MTAEMVVAEAGKRFPRRNILWIDATANLPTTHHRDGMAALLDRAATAGFTTVVVDVKPPSGEVLYASRLAPRLEQWEPGVELPRGYDLLAVAVEEARSRGLEVLASLNVFSEGYRQHGRLRGALVADPARAGWECVAYSAAGLRDAADAGLPGAADGGTQGGIQPAMAPALAPMTRFHGKDWAFVNPALPEVQEYELALLEEVARSYPVDGVILDRARYSGLDTDFSPASHAAFCRFVGTHTKRWPEDVYGIVPAPHAFHAGAGDGQGKPERETGEGALLRSSEGVWIRPGPLFGPWLLWRAQVIHDFVAAARRRVKAARADALFGIYAGSWFPSYYELGVNWASSRFRRDAVASPGPVPPGYEATGYAEELDLFLSGNYYPEVWEEEVTQGLPETAQREPGQPPQRTWWYSVAGAARMVRHVTGHVRPTYGSLYLVQYEDHPERLGEAVRACQEGSDGVMIFDSSHLDRLQWWEALGAAIRGGLGAGSPGSSGKGRDGGSQGSHTGDTAQGGAEYAPAR